ncbi:MAG: DUF3108 domain-containing protein [Thermodesulfobacteriota bacterium]
MITIKYRKAFITLLWALLLALSAAGTGVAQEASLPFAVGETLTFTLYWTVIPAGEAEITVLPDTVVNGIPARHFLMTVRTNSFIDNFYKVRDRVEAFTDLPMTRSLLYYKEQHEGSSHHKVRVDFDWENNLAIFNEDGKVAKKTEIVPGTFDVLALFYRFRMEELSVGKVIELPVTDGSKALMGRGKVEKKETVEVPAGKFPAFMITPELTHMGGVFQNSKGKLSLWFADDSRRTVVKVQGSVSVGSFHAKLTKISGPAPVVTARAEPEDVSRSAGQ